MPSSQIRSRRRFRGESACPTCQRWSLLRLPNTQFIVFLSQPRSRGKPHGTVKRPYFDHLCVSHACTLCCESSFPCPVPFLPARLPPLHCLSAFTHTNAWAHTHRLPFSILFSPLLFGHAHPLLYGRAHPKDYHRRRRRCHTPPNLCS